MNPKDYKVISTKWTDNKTIDLIRTLRNDLIKDFLDERFLMEYLSEQYHQKQITRTRMEFLRKDLKELLMSPVDTHHYSELIEKIRNENSSELTLKNERLFYKEIERLLVKNLF